MSQGSTLRRGPHTWVQSSAVAVLKFFIVLSLAGCVGSDIRCSSDPHHGQGLGMRAGLGRQACAPSATFWGGDPGVCEGLHSPHKYPRPKAVRHTKHKAGLGTADDAKGCFLLSDQRPRISIGHWTRLAAFFQAREGVFSVPRVPGPLRLCQEEETQFEDLGTGKPPSGCPELSNAAWGCSGCAPAHTPPLPPGKPMQRRAWPHARGELSD